MATGVLAADEGDNDDSRETATEMAPNSTETGALESNDTDWYAFDVEAGERIWVHLDLGENDTTLDQNTSARLDIFGPSGENVNDYPHDGMGPAYRPTAGAPMQAAGGTIAEQSGTYYVRAKGTNITDYDLTVETQRLDEHDPNERPATATSIESGETVSAVMSGPDLDTYAIDLEKGETINVTANHSDSVLVNAQLLHPNASDESPDRFVNDHVVEWDYSDSFTHTANTSGTYFVWISPEEEGIGSFDEEAPYDLSVSVSEDDSTDENDSETDDGPTETPEDDDSTESTPDETEQSDSDDSADEGDSTDDSTESTPDETDQSDSDESVDDSDSTGDDTATESPTDTDDTDQSDSDGSVDNVSDDAEDASDRSEC
ncbi:pre-peptidase C-terminal domain-containing protein [Halocatena salina]|uniref:DNA polymerase V family protein n=1 Tax=Halocatena salina TaxID=2934340 RepID=A0A8U0A2S5_9EURY|nr:pre-peptidase C-terminal domain-containing protein [Halocatena salina]UPM43511.1 DNA polymerase V family protein [Halocatena salina]